MYYALYSMAAIVPLIAWTGVAIIGAWLLSLPDPASLFASAIVFLVGLFLAFRGR